jgi:hypothetical protein
MREIDRLGDSLEGAQPGRATQALIVAPNPYSRLRGIGERLSTVRSGKTLSVLERSFSHG